MTLLSATLDHDLRREFRLTSSDIESVISDALAFRTPGAFAQVILQKKRSEQFTWQNGLLLSAASSSVTGCHVRVVNGDQTGFASSDEANLTNLRGCAKKARKSLQFAEPAVAPKGMGTDIRHDLYPVTRALFGTRPRFPLPIDIGLSLRMASRLAATAQRFTAASQDDSFIWPLSEAATANFTIAEVNVGRRTIPQPIAPDLNSLLAHVAGSLFADVDAKASFWQRARGIQSAPPVTQTASVTETPDTAPMLDAFRLAYTNLHEIWSLVLPPNSLLGLKKLSVMQPENFRMPDNLWTRIVYDFILAYRLRTINRGHLLGALTPLYLAWVASHLTLIHTGTAPEKHIQDLASAFETDKPYLVSRWRWPDRFNP